MAYDGDGGLLYEAVGSGNTITSSDYLLRSTALGAVLTKLDAAGNKDTTFVPAGGLIDPMQQVNTQSAQTVSWRHKDATGLQTDGAAIDPFGNTINNQQPPVVSPPPVAAMYGPSYLGAGAFSFTNANNFSNGCMAASNNPADCDSVMHDRMSPQFWQNLPGWHGDMDVAGKEYENYVGAASSHNDMSKYKYHQWEDSWGGDTFSFNGRGESVTTAHFIGGFAEGDSLDSLDSIIMPHELLLLLHETERPLNDKQRDIVKDVVGTARNFLERFPDCAHYVAANLKDPSAELDRLQDSMTYFNGVDFADDERDSIAATNGDMFHRGTGKLHIVLGYLFFDDKRTQARAKSEGLTPKMDRVLTILHEFKHYTEHRGHIRGKAWDTSDEWDKNIIKFCIK